MSNDDNHKPKLVLLDRDDGFGAQFQTVIFYILYAEFNNLEYIHKKIKNMEHNYNEDINFIENVNNCMNIQNNYRNYDEIICSNVSNIDRCTIYNKVEENIDLYASNNVSINKIKNCFWKNKDMNYFKNKKINIAVHIRRPNQCDNRIEGADTPDSYYLNVINHIRNKYNNHSLCFHIYSQGNVDNFNCYKSDDVIFHIDEELTQTFIGLVFSDILVMSGSSFSYSAALLTNAKVYYLPFWHKPKKDWIIYK